MHNVLSEKSTLPTEAYLDAVKKILKLIWERREGIAYGELTAELASPLALSAPSQGLELLSTNLPS
jgi:hypothetical protein